ncbi:CopD family protein [Roseococcus sp. SDR]|uniref:CopD family protein n=1 Tax=Roseococcus sp. SDR TaxID=2835532 RepID=UPI001BD16127|nr:CopD family protein [Roseococcus sp. SDR]MBS7790525.1 CopD family protein [Roseococcus sp. SDR]MBV1845839.1 CopD family protein [Roseococcus sp. SDR]
MANLAFALHVVFAALWVGGMAFAILALRPALSVLEPPQRLALMGRVHRRFFLIVWHAMPIVLVSGYWLLFGHYGGFRGVGWHVHLMHLTGLLMAAIYLAIFFGPWRAMREALAAGDAPRAAAANDRIRLLVTANLLLGLTTLGIAAWGRIG